MPGAKVLAWAVVGLAALRKRKDQSTARQARVDPFRPRPPRRAGPTPTGRWRRPNRASLPPHRGPTGRGRAPASHDSADRPGDEAELPTQIPPQGWWQVTRRAFKESSADNVGIMAGGIAYAAFLAISRP